jgi:HlyD family secretion protein
MERTCREYERNRKLFENGVIAAKEYDDYLFHLTSAQNEVKIFANNYFSKWQSDITQYKTSLKEINSNLEQVQKEKDLYFICAPITGNIEQFTGIYKGGSLSAGETVAVISPDSNLISEIFVSPGDIGYLNQSDKVWIQVDAFNYNEWGMLPGNINNISSDFFSLNNMPMFRVRCTMDKNYLLLHNGLKGYLKKGMTVRARFRIAELSLFQILYQRIDRWINPAMFNKSQVHENN